MDRSNLGLADRYLPLIYFEQNGSAISFKNVLDLKESGQLEKLEALSAALLLERRPYSNEDKLPALADFVGTLRALASANEIKHVGEKEEENLHVITRQADGLTAVETRLVKANELLLPNIKKLFAEIAEQYSAQMNAPFNYPDNAKAGKTYKDVLEQSLKILSVDSVKEYYRNNVEVVPGASKGQLRELIVKVVNKPDGAPIDEVEAMLKLRMYPSSHTNNGFAASVTSMGGQFSIKSFGLQTNRGVALLDQILEEKEKKQENPEKAKAAAASRS